MDCCHLCVLCCCGRPHGGHGGGGGGGGFRGGGHGHHHGGGHSSGGGLHCGSCGDCNCCDPGDCGRCDLSCGDCGGCDCNCGSLKGGGEGILGAICVVIIFLAPLVILALLALPFWFLSQWIVSKLDSDTSFWVTILIFAIVFVIPPCVLWYGLFTLICANAGNSTAWTVFCYLWSVIELVLSV